MSSARGATISQTWWGSRWIQSLRRFGRDWSVGLSKARGETDSIDDLKIAPGQIEAVVPGHGDDEAGQTFELSVRVATLDDGTWRRVLRRLAGKARYAARLLSGEMPRDIERVFAQSKASLFPRRRRDVDYECSCDQRYSPCSHVAAVQFMLAEAFDRDPFLLFELRGRRRDAVLAELREIRGASASGDGGPGDRGTDGLGDDEVWVQPNPEDYTVAGEDLATIGFHIAAAQVTVGAVRALGAPRSWLQPLALLKAMVPLYRAASSDALEMAWGGEEEIPASARLPRPESEASLVAMAESMVESALPASEPEGSSRRGKRGGRKRGGRKRRGRGGKGNGGGETNGATPGKKRRRRGRRGGKKAPGGAPQGGGGQQGSGSGDPNKKRRRRRRRGGRGGGGSQASA